MNAKWDLLLPMLLISLLSCTRDGADPGKLNRGPVKIHVDALLGLDPVDTRAQLISSLEPGEAGPADLALDVQLGGGIRGRLRLAGLEVRSSRLKTQDWKELVAELVQAIGLSEQAKGKPEQIRALVESTDRQRRVAGIALLGQADDETHKIFIRNLPIDLAPNQVREIAASLLATTGERNTLTLIALSQRYPALFDELLGAVAEREGQLAVAYLTAVAKGHEDDGARATAQAALESRP